jgi:hypothetical protein
MDSFFVFLRKSLVASVFIMFAVAAVYTPQNWNKVEYAHAGGGGGGATLWAQLKQIPEDTATTIATTISSAKDTITAFMTKSLWVKESVLDGIAWNIAKAIISSMLKDLVKWINSGFKGSPMFVQDLEGFLRNAADGAIGSYIKELGGPLSFLCDPFKLDIQVAVSLEYERIRSNQAAPTCTLSGVLKNIDSFTTGAQGSFANGGWDAWFDITANPTMYTPYGAELAAKNQAYIRILNSKGEETTKMNWGSGFLSGEICNMVQGNGASKEECFISKPGKVVQEALSFNLDSGRQSLITADEFNEIIAALLGQFAQKAISGAAGLLGLSGGTGHTYTGYTGGSYINQMVASSTAMTSNGKETMENSLDIQQEYGAFSSTSEAMLTAHSNDPAVSKSDRDLAKVYAKEALNISLNTIENVNAIMLLIKKYDATADQTERAKILSQFSILDLYSVTQMNESEDKWEDLLGQDIPKP